jgi:hypothetical protein
MRPSMSTVHPFDASTNQIELNVVIGPSAWKLQVWPPFVVRYVTPPLPQAQPCCASMNWTS